MGEGKPDMMAEKEILTPVGKAQHSDIGTMFRKQNLNDYSNQIYKVELLNISSL